jgi:Raf kinase inhibitor-like YbhB/YbcL family protein
VVKAGDMIDMKYRCGTVNVSPPLSWPAGPAGTMSYAVTMLHAASVHWVLWDIPADVTSLPEAVERKAEPSVPAGAKQAMPNLDGATWYGYTGPCPHGANQHYEYNVYAMKVAKLDGVTTMSKATEVNAAILKSGALATAQLSVMATGK